MESIRALIKKNQKVVLGLAVALILFAVYNTFFKAPPVAENLTGETRGIDQLELGREIVTTLNRLKSINIDPAVLQDPLFRSLYDFSKPLPDFAGGKQNPFEVEIPGIGAPSVTPRDSEDTGLTEDTTETEVVDDTTPVDEPADETTTGDEFDASGV